jgi:hypothetical protein
MEHRELEGCSSHPKVQCDLDPLQHPNLGWQSQHLHAKAVGCSQKKAMTCNREESDLEAACNWKELGSEVPSTKCVEELDSEVPSTKCAEELDLEAACDWKDLGLEVPS